MGKGADPVGMVRASPLVGRRAELTEIADALGDHTSTGVVLVGPSGVGKTELARHAVWTAHAAGFVAATVTATRAASTIPFGALEPIVGDAVEASSVGLLRSIRDWILEMAGGGPMVLLFDDAHLLDDMSATLVLRLAREEQVFVLATVRSGEDAPDSITALWKDAGARRIDVAPLDLSQTEELLRRTLGGPVAVPALSRLVELSQGVPLALLELVDAARRSEILVLRDDVWCLEGELVLSDRLIDLIQVRLAGRSDEEREALATIALGEPVPLPVASHLAGAEMLQVLEERHLVTVRPASDDIVVAHPLYGEVAVRGLGELRRRRILTALADATVEHDRPSTTTDLRVAIWRLSAGGDVDTEVLIRGAEAAYRASDHPTTVELAAAAWERSPSVEAGHLLGLASGRLTSPDDAESALAGATAMLDRAPDDRMRVLVTLARSENLFRGRNDAAAALSCTEAGEAAVRDPAWRDELVAHRAMLVLNTGDVPRALELTEPLLTDTTPDRPFVKAAYAAELALVYAGKCERAADLAQRALPVHERVWEDDLFQTEPAVHHVAAILALIESGQLHQAETYADIAVHVAAQSGESYGLGYMSMLAGLVALRRGKVVTSRRRCVDAMPLFRATGYPSPLRWVLAGAAIADAMCGDVTSARENLASTDALATATPVRLGETTVHEARGWVHVASGDYLAAREAFRIGAEDALDRGEVSSAAHLLHCLARVGDAADVADRLAELSTEMEGAAHPRRVRHVRALAAGDGPGLDAVAEQFAEAGADLLAAEAAAEAVRAHRRRGDQRSATRSARISDMHADRCEGARTPSMTITAAVEPLTNREREIALLAAEGLASREIADRLVVSRRTVDNHLQRVFGKLGISGRGELPEALGHGG